MLFFGFICVFSITGSLAIILQTAPSRAATGDRNLTEGSTPFLKAATTSDVEMMRLLLDWGANLYQTNQINANALMMVAGLNWQPQGSIGPQDDAVEAAKILLDWGLDINATNDQGQTALHGAAARTEDRDANKLIQFLVDRGANLYARTKAGAPAGRGGAGGAAPPPPPPIRLAQGRRPWGRRRLMSPRVVWTTLTRWAIPARARRITGRWRCSRS